MLCVNRPSFHQKQVFLLVIISIRVILICEVETCKSASFGNQLVVGLELLSFTGLDSYASFATLIACKHSKTSYVSHTNVVRESLSKGGVSI